MKIKELAEICNRLCEEGKGNSKVYLREEDVCECIDIDNKGLEFIRKMIMYKSLIGTSAFNKAEYDFDCKKASDYLDELDEERNNEMKYQTDKYFDCLETIYDDDSLIIDYEKEDFEDVVSKR